MADISKINLGGVEYDIRDQKLKGELAEVATSGSYGDLKDKPSIPAAVTEQTVKDWGFTKNEGTYSKPAGGIPYSDMAQGVKESLDKAGTALQSGDLQAINQRVNVLVEEAERLEADKQDVLSDGVNIKTINGQSILGEGNIKIEGGGSSVEVVDSLDSEDTTAALSANQGRVLKEMIDDLPSGGLELRELKMSGSAEDNAYNLETLELVEQGKSLAATKSPDGSFTYVTYIGERTFSLIYSGYGVEVQLTITMAEDGSITPSQDFQAPRVIQTPSDVVAWKLTSDILAAASKHEPVYVIYNMQFCLVDYFEATGIGSKVTFQFNYGSQRFERVYNATTGEEISTTEIPLGGGGTAAEGAKLYPIYSPKLTGADSITEEQKAANKAAFEAAARGEQMWCYAVVDESTKISALSVLGDSEMLMVGFQMLSVYETITATINQVYINPDGSIMHEVEQEATAGSGGGGSIILDTEMSDTSENAVSNKVIKEYVDKAAPRQFGDDFAEDFN